MSASVADLDFGAPAWQNPERQANSPAHRVRLAGILTSGATASCERVSMLAENSCSRHSHHPARGI